eukprot:2928323-Amphidinium_carterae.1
MDSLSSYSKGLNSATEKIRVSKRAVTNSKAYLNKAQKSSMGQRRCLKDDATMRRHVCARRAILPSSPVPNPQVCRGA